MSADLFWHPGSDSYFWHDLQGNAPTPPQLFELCEIVTAHEMHRSRAASQGTPHPAQIPLFDEQIKTPH